MKKLRLLFMSVAAMIALAVNAAVIDSGSCGTNVTWVFNDDGSIVISGTGAMTDYTYNGNQLPWNDYRYQIKSVVIEYGVTQIGDDAFYYCPNITSVSIANTVTRIGKMAFSNDRSLTSIDIPNSVTTIGFEAFCGCDLQSVVIPNSVTSIDSGAFYENLHLTSATLSNSLSKIEERVFSACSALTSIDIPNSVTSIGNEAFAGCTSLKSVTIPNSVTSIGQYAFNCCWAIISIDVPRSVTSIGENAFMYVPNVKYTGTATGSAWGARCVNGYVDGNIVYTDATKTTLVACVQDATGDVVIPNSVTAIGDYAFLYCRNLTSVKIPSSVTTIGNLAFLECNGLSTLTIPNSVTSIGMAAFLSCKGLTTLTIPNSLTNIGEQAFNTGENLTNVYCYANVPPTIGENTIYISPSATLHVPTASVDAYKAADYWKKFTNIQGTRGIITSGDCGENGANVTYTLYDDGEFVVSGTGKMGGYYTEATNPWIEYKSQIKKAVIEDGVTNIYYCAFSKCSNLSSVSIPNSVTEIGRFAFERCNLTSVSIPNTVTLIDAYAFSQNDLSSVVIPNSVKILGMGAFMYNRNMTSITIPNTITKFDKYLFEHCEKLAAIDIPNSVTCIEEYAFSGCYSLTSLVIPDNVTKIGEWACCNCENLTSVNIPDKVTEIGEKAFYDCYSLTSLDVPAGVTSIGDQAFYHVANVKYTGTATGAPWDARCVNGYVDGNLVYTDNTKTALAACFIDATGEVVIPNGVKSMGDYTFYYCDKISSVTIPSSMETMGMNIFVGSPQVEDVYCYATTPPAYTGIAHNKATLHVPSASLSAYKSTEPWKNFRNIVGIETTVTSITLSKTSAELDVFELLYLTATVMPEDVADKSVKWSSSNEKVAVVNGSGKVTPRSAGTATITCTANDGSGAKATCVITVKPAKVKSISLDQTSATLLKGETMTLVATIMPSYATNKDVTWKSSDDSILTVSEDGVVTCVGEGTATITVTTTDGSNLSASCVFNYVDGIITPLMDASNVSTVYGTNGVKRNSLHKGINIVVTKDGKRVKVVK